ncbi:hypothetical protein [Schumannella sp. 10F1B-5-1]|uniref:hypothetical protein n=1 Tax=Schumannella sp. 10F1B-5-1 TaxID=2590780 RepID=UPI0011304A48|nr:hypothetical protein [Schumannella sp. 10F1B-5-1]TPW72258.1 hypothetical protein FJ658_08270 [Schumannella sp. 10F1B-5-1]
MTGRQFEIASYSCDIPGGWWQIPLEGADDVDSRTWANRVVAEVEEQAEQVGEIGGFADQLVELRRRLLADGVATAVVSVRPEFEVSIGCLLTIDQFAMDADDGPEVFAAMLQQGAETMAPGNRNHVAEVWSERQDDRTVVGLYQRLDIASLDDDLATLEERTMFGVFPDAAVDMVRLTFTVADLGVFDDMRAETGAIVRSLTTELTAVAA